MPGGGKNGRGMMKEQLARSGGEAPATVPLPTIAMGPKVRSLGLPANDTRRALTRRLLPSGLFLASILLLLIVI